MNRPKIMVLRSDRLGDAILGSAYLATLVESHPEIETHLWLAPDMVPLKNVLHPDLQVSPLPFDRHLRCNDSELEAWLQQIQSEQYEELIIPQFTLGFPEALALAYTDIPVRRGFTNHECGVFPDWLYLRLEKPPREQSGWITCGPTVDPYLHETEKYRALAESQGLRMENVQPKLYVTGLDGRRTSDIVVWPGCGEETRRWPAENFAETLSRLHVSAVTIGTTETEKLVAEDLQVHLGRRGIASNMHICDPARLDETARWLAGFERLLTNDTGIAHLGAAVGCSVIAISSSRHQGRFSVCGESSTTIFADVPCRRCGGCMFNEPLWPCVSDIHPEDVAEVVARGTPGEVLLPMPPDGFFAGPNVFQKALTARKRVDAAWQRQRFALSKQIIEGQRVRAAPEPEEAVQWPKISVITPSWQQGGSIEDTIHSVLDQNYPNFEHIIVDACSTDQTVEVLQSYPHLRWVSEPDRGQAHAINKGIMMSTGEILAYLNADDVYRPGAFHAVGRIFRDQPQVQILVGNCDYINEASEITGHMKAQAGEFEDLVRYWGWEKWFCIPQPAVFIRRELLAEVGLFDTSYHMAMDYDMWLRVAQVTKFHVLDQTLAAFRLAPHTKTVGRAHELYFEELAVSRRRWKQLPPGRRAMVALQAHRHAGHKLLVLAEHFAVTGKNCRHARKLLLRSFRIWPPIVLHRRCWLTARRL